MIVFATKKYEFLKEKLLKNSSLTDGVLKRKTFSDGETYLKTETSVRNQDVMILGGTISDEDTLEIYDLACALAQFEAKSISIVIPFYGYSTMERAVSEGEVVKAKTRARLLSMVPQAYQGNTVYLLDLHAEGIVHYFEGNIKRHHMSAKDLILNHIRSLGLSDYVLASADQGRAKQIQKMADQLQVDSAFISKRRYSDTRVVSQAANADVANRVVIIYDDMIRSGSSIVEAMQVYHAAGASDIYVYTTHGVFCAGAKDKIKSAPGFKSLVYTDSLPQSTVGSNEECLSIDTLIKQEIKDKI